MVDLQIVKLMHHEASVSEELRFLMETCVWEARQVFEDVRVIEVAPAELGDDVGFDAEVTTLVLAEPHPFVARRSLRIMRAALDDGHEVAVPTPIHEFIRATGRGVYTLHDYEVIEEEILASSLPHSAPQSHLPAALAAPAWLRRIAPGGVVGRLLTDAQLLADTVGGADARRAGVYFECADYYGQPREDILGLLPERAARVLEVGCGRGHTAALVAARLGCPVVGVELNPEIAREAAGRLQKVITGDVLEVDIEGSFDVIIATEVLEHVDDTGAFLRRMHGLLSPGGRLILSVPNVGHYSVVAGLVGGRWDYTHAGLLCITHRRFFTRYSLSEALRHAGFHDQEVHPQTTELPESWRRLAGLPGADEASLRTLGFLVACSRAERNLRPGD